jgi:hypothetical protein
MLKELAETYPQLYLDPDKSCIDEYRAVVLSGKRPVTCSLDHFTTDERDRREYIETPAGKACVITLYNRRDFEVFVRCMMAAKKGPQNEIPETMGASTLITFNWPRIHAHMDAFMEEQRAAGVASPDYDAEFKRFTSVRANIQDMLIVLSHGPYSNVTADQVNRLESMSGREPMDDAAWDEASDTVRKFHELTHFVCRRLYPDDIDEIRDELIADAVGIYAAFGEYCKDMEELFLGISEDRYTGGRIENYAAEGTDMEELAKQISARLAGYEAEIAASPVKDIYDLMMRLMKY